MNSVLFSSAKMDWETPQPFYDALDAEFRFTCDVAANGINHKHECYYDEQQNGLIQPWSGICWCNPPYGRDIAKWVEKAHREAVNGKATTVMLLPARTDTKYFHEYIYGQHEIRFVKGRLRFVGSKSSAPFPSMVVVFRRQE